VARDLSLLQKSVPAMGLIRPSVQ